MTLTKRDLVIQITEELNQEQKKLEQQQQEAEKPAKGKPGRKKETHPPLEQRQVLEVVQKTLDGITRALANGKKVELRNFGVFEIKVRKARIGRNPNAPSTDVPIPARSVVKFKAGKEMRAEVLKLPAKPAPGVLNPPSQT
jgi:nucleoid DNA-binding protein